MVVGGAAVPKVIDPLPMAERDDEDSNEENENEPEVLTIGLIGTFPIPHSHLNTSNPLSHRSTQRRQIIPAQRPLRNDQSPSLPNPRQNQTLPNPLLDTSSPSRRLPRARPALAYAHGNSSPVGDFTDIEGVGGVVVCVPCGEGYSVGEGLWVGTSEFEGGGEGG